MDGYGGSYDYNTDNSVVKKFAKSYNIDHKRDYKAHKIESRAKLSPLIDIVLLTKAFFPIVIAMDVCLQEVE